jgi:hypothetical protein
MNHTLIAPLFEIGDLVTFREYLPRKFIYASHKKKWDDLIDDLGCPISQNDTAFLVIFSIPAKELFTKSINEHLSSDDNGYIIVSQLDGMRYFVYEDEIGFL